MSSSGLGLRGLRLYASVLRAHRALPPQMRELGDRYVREEFRRHRTASATFLQPFLSEWQNYVASLPRAGAEEASVVIGRDLAPDQAASLSQEQLEQLARLREEAARVTR